jgi:hypothetical protein
VTHLKQKLEIVHARCDTHSGTFCTVIVDQLLDRSEQKSPECAATESNVTYDLQIQKQKEILSEAESRGMLARLLMHASYVSA